MAVIRTTNPSGGPGATGVARRMSAAEQIRAERKARRLAQLVVGLCGYGAAVMLLVMSGLGAASWSVLSEGVAHRTGVSFGWATNLIALAVLVAWVPLRELPGLGTVLNVLLVGIAADLTAVFVPAPHSLATRVMYLVLGVVLLAFFDAMYLGARFGSGPRDGLMTGLVRLTGRPVAVVRTAIEVVVLGVGWILGGHPGVGTLIVALLMGPLVAIFLSRLTIRLAGDRDVIQSETASARV